MNEWIEAKWIFACIFLENICFNYKLYFSMHIKEHIYMYKV